MAHLRRSSVSSALRLESLFRHTLLVTLLVVCFTASVVVVARQAHAGSSTITIAQVYSAGGEPGALWTSDYVVLFNMTAAPISLSGWTLQTKASAAPVWQAIPLCGTIQAERYYLIQLGSGGPNGSPLPPADCGGSINLDRTDFTVALVGNSAPLTDPCPAPALVVDLAGWGAPTTCAEGAPAGPSVDPALALRRTNPCDDPGDTFTDLTYVPANPQTSADSDPCVNPPPSIDPIAPLTTGEGEVAYQQVYAVDPNGDIVTLSLADEPPFVTLAQDPPSGSTRTGTLTIQPGPNAAEGMPSKNWSFRLLATDDNPSPASSERTVLLTVTRTNTQPVFTQPAPAAITVNLNEEVIFPLSATDPDLEQTLEFTVTPPSPWLDVFTIASTPGVGATGELRIKVGPNAGGASQVGTWCFHVGVRDSDADSVRTSTCIAVRSTSGNTPMAGSWPNGVNMATRELATEAVVDIDLGGPLPLTFGRVYGSEMARDGVTGSFGPNWLGTFDWKLTVDGTDATITSDQGEQLLFGEITSIEATQRSHHHERLVVRSFDPLHRLQRGRKSRTYEFDTATGLLQRVLDEKGNSLTCTYSGGLLASVEDGLGRVLTFGHDGSGRVTTVGDGTRTVTYAYDPAGQLASVTDAAGGTTIYAYDTGPIPGLLVGTTLPEGNTPRTYAYDPNGRVSSACDAGANCWTYADTPTPGTTMSPPGAGTWTAAHDSSFHLTSLQDALAGTTIWTYDANGRPTSRTTPLGNTTALSYDIASGFPAVLTLPDLSTAQFQWTSTPLLGFDVYRMTLKTNPDGTTEAYGYDAAGNLTSRVDQAGKTWSSTYNARGQRLTSTNPSGGVTTLTYDAFFRPSSRTDHAGNTTTYGYDPLHRLTTITHPDLTSRTISYDANDHPVSRTDEGGEVWNQPLNANGRPTTLTDPLGHSTTLAYDAMDRVTSVTDAIGGVRQYAYDARGHLASVTDKTGRTTTYGYDARGLLTSITDPGGNTTTYAYDPDGRRTSVTDPLLHTTTLAYDSRGRVTAVTDPLTNTTTYGYDAIGRVTQIGPPTGAPTTFEYDPRGLLARETSGAVEIQWRYNLSGALEEIEDANHNVWTYTTDPQLRPLSRLDPLGRSIGFSYDTRNRVSQATSPAGTQTLGYDAVGRVTSRQYSDGLSLSFAYDDAGRLTAATGVALAYDDADRLTASNGMPVTRDAEGRVTSLTYGTGKTVMHTYDTRGLPATMQDWLGGTTTFSYDAAGRMTSIGLPNGGTMTFVYDAAGRLTSRVDSRPGATDPPVSSIQLTRDGLGRPATRTRDVPLRAAPDPASLSFAYDAASQVSTQTHDGLGRLLNDGTTTYEWDGASRLTRYEAGADSPRFTYDAFGLNLSRSIPVTGVIWDFCSNRSGRPNLATMSDAGHQHFYVHTPDGVPLYRIDDAGAGTPGRHYYHFDDSGNTVAITNETGAVETMYDYSPSGMTAVAGLTEGNPLTFRGGADVLSVGNIHISNGSTYEGKTGRCISCPAAPLAKIGGVSVGAPAGLGEDLERWSVSDWGNSYPDGSTAQWAWVNRGEMDGSTAQWAWVNRGETDGSTAQWAWGNTYPGGSTAQWACGNCYQDGSTAQWAFVAGVPAWGTDETGPAGGGGTVTRIGPIVVPKGYRPPRVTPRPRVTGPQTALIQAQGQGSTITWVDPHDSFNSSYTLVPHRVRPQGNVYRSLVEPLESLLWSRVSVPSIGAGRNFFFLPEVDDEVLVGF